MKYYVYRTVMGLPALSRPHSLVEADDPRRAAEIAACGGVTRRPQRVEVFDGPRQDRDPAFACNAQIVLTVDGGFEAWEIEEFVREHDAVVTCAMRGGRAVWSVGIGGANGDDHTFERAADAALKGKVES